MDDNKFFKYIFLFMFIINLLILMFNINIFVIIFTILFTIALIIMFYSKRISDLFSKKLIDKKTKNSIKEDIVFYREIIQEYSIGELSFIDGYDINYPNDVIAILLKLQLNKVITINDNNIIINKKNNYKLKESEKYVLDSIKDGKVVLSNDMFLTEIISTESQSDNLLKFVEFKDSKGLFILALIIIGFLVFGFVSSTVFNIDSIYFNYFLVGVFFIVFIIVVVGIAYLSNGDRYSWRLTNNGKKILIKLQGLKNYLSEFTNINKRKIEELFIWDDYLIYSVMFGINKDIIKKYSSLIIIQEKINLY